MELFVSTLFWLGVIGLVDGSMGILLSEKWRKMGVKWNVQKVALIEIGIALTLLAIHFAAR